ncbi:cytochrome P450 [Nocardia sp. XZ_19_385]|uniref:cytochrome P450 n=1 Tax=Nocardia sp. XZ_19_385 TaxID=2769488 RepID=UPI001E2B5E2E|nr:cytochrome P450 [Nocardia sp. XZ_19_385]
MNATLPLITEPARVREVLAHCPMPPVDRGATTGIAWLRAQVPRFSNDDEHRRRRALVVAELERLEPDSLRIAARAADGRLAHVRVLADALGLHGISAEAVELVAAHYQPHTPDNPAADRAVEDLVAACGGSADEATAARISLLVQACQATTDLLANARMLHDQISENDWAAAVLARTMAHNPPVRRTRRIVDGELVELDLTQDGLGFGSGPHECPGQAHALAIAAGILEARA